MPDLFTLLPPLGRVAHPLLVGQEIAVIGAYILLYDKDVLYFQISPPRYWARPEEGPLTVGVNLVGGSVREGADPLTSLRQAVGEKLGIRFRFDTPDRTALLHRHQLAEWLELPPSRKHATPYLIDLVSPRLGGPHAPDHLAILVFPGRAREEPASEALSSLLAVARPALESFLTRGEWPLHEARAHPDLSFDLGEDLPRQSVLRPVLAARALQTLVRHGHTP